VTYDGAGAEAGVSETVFCTGLDLQDAALWPRIPQIPHLRCFLEGTEAETETETEGTEGTEDILGKKGKYAGRKPYHFSSRTGVLNFLRNFLPKSLLIWMTWM
jgi:hypothetical protein